MARKTKAEAEQTRQKIIAAARSVFHSEGVSRTSLEKIAQVAGVTRGAVYWHFANKASLFFAMREEAKMALNRAETHLDALDAADPLAAIECSLLEFFAVLKNDPLVRNLRNHVPALRICR